MKNNAPFQESDEGHTLNSPSASIVAMCTLSLLQSDCKGMLQIRNIVR